MDDSTAREVIAVQAIADQYRRDGYEVSREVPLDFAPDIKADLVVRKNGRAKVVEVKSQSSLAVGPKSGDLAVLLRDRPGWDFEFILVGEPPRLDRPDGVEAEESEGALSRLDGARRALEGGQAEAAFLLAWSGCEAVLRALVLREGAPEANVSAPDAVLGQAVFFGVMGHEDYHRLAELRKYRDALVHGFRVDGFSAELVTELIATVRRIEAEQPFLDD